MVVVLGIPLDENSSYLQGAASAPQYIRDAYHSTSSNYCTESGHDLNKDNRWKDMDDLLLSPMPKAIAEIEQAIAGHLASGNTVLSLGGDHSVSYPVISAYSKKFANLNVLHIDAHSDLYHNFEDNPYSHASPFARVMEEGRVKRLVQVGIRTHNPHQKAQAEKFGVEIIEMKDWNDSKRFRFDGPLYVSLDLDALDPAFVPGVSHYEPGGFTTRQVLNIIQHLEADLVGADIVELNPARDINGMTAMVAAKFLKELLAKLIEHS